MKKLLIWVGFELAPWRYLGVHVSSVENHEIFSSCFSEDDSEIDGSSIARSLKKGRVKQLILSIALREKGSVLPFV